MQSKESDSDSILEILLCISAIILLFALAIIYLPALIT